MGALLVASTTPPALVNVIVDSKLGYAVFGCTVTVQVPSMLTGLPVAAAEAALLHPINVAAPPANRTAAAMFFTRISLSSLGV